MCLSGNKYMCYFPIEDAPYTGKKVSSKKASAFSDTGKQSKSVTYQKCAYTHPPLKITESITVYGGAASDPVKKDLDIYVSLDFGKSHDECMYPWNGAAKQFIYYPITDMSVPKDVADFKKMISWLAAQAEAGKSIHIGCIGGHGRTGMVLSALVKTITGNEDAIQFVRDNYCKKAVESSSQVDFLHTEFGIKKREGSKSWDKGTFVSTPSYAEYDKKWKPSYSKNHNNKYVQYSDDYVVPVKAVKVDWNVWGCD